LHKLFEISTQGVVPLFTLAERRGIHVLPYFLSVIAHEQ